MPRKDFACTYRLRYPEGYVERYGSDIFLRKATEMAPAQ